MNFKKRIPFVDFKLFWKVYNSKNLAFIKTKSRATTIIPFFVGLNFKVYTGRSYSKVYVTQRMVGHKLGEFAYTRKVGKIHMPKRGRKR